MAGATISFHLYYPALEAVAVETDLQFPTLFVLSQTDRFWKSTV
jgi:hypothetical protein